MQTGSINHSKERYVTSQRKGDWMQTYTGRRFYPLDPRAEEVDVLDLAHHLSMTCRYGGACLRFYSVAEHSVMMCRAAPSEVKLWALLHDGSEAYLNDLVRPLKTSLPEYKQVERALQCEVYRRFGLQFWQEPGLIHEMDDRIIVDERRQNMANTGERWFTDDLEPLGVKLEFWTPEVAERTFLHEFGKLTAGKEKQRDLI